MLQVLEYAILMRFADLDTADRLDNVYRWAIVQLSPERFVFVNEWRVGAGDWTFVGEEEEPTQDLLE